jgi:DNA-binding response OmpR family regulator
VVADSAYVLVVDDEPHLCNGLRRILEKEGYEVSTAQDGQTALGLVDVRTPDVILLDLMMPGLDGREVCRRVREVAPATQVIYFTAKAEPVDPTVLRHLRAEADAFITKPATSRQILAKVSSVLRHAR